MTLYSNYDRLIKVIYIILNCNLWFTNFNVVMVECNLNFYYDESERKVIELSIAERINELRKLAGITQEQLGEMLGVSRQAVSKWESAQANPDIQYIIKMSEIFHVPTDYLLLGKESSQGASPLADIAAKKLKYKFGVFLTIIGILGLFAFSSWHPDGYSVDLGWHYFYGLFGWLLHEKQWLFPFFLCCMALFGGLGICGYQAFSYKK